MRPISYGFAFFQDRHEKSRRLRKSPGKQSQIAFRRDASFQLCLPRRESRIPSASISSMRASDVAYTRAFGLIAQHRRDHLLVLLRLQRASGVHHSTLWRAQRAERKRGSHVAARLGALNPPAQDDGGSPDCAPSVPVPLQGTSARTRSYWASVVERGRVGEAAMTRSPDEATPCAIFRAARDSFRRRRCAPADCVQRG